MKNEAQCRPVRLHREVVADALQVADGHARSRDAQIAEFKEELARRIAAADAGAVRRPGGCHGPVCLAISGATQETGTSGFRLTRRL